MESKKLSRRDFLRLSAFAAAGAILAGCSCPPQVVEKEVTVTEMVEKEVKVPGEDKIVEVTAVPADLAGSIAFWAMPNGADPAAAINAEIEAFSKAYPGVEITPEIVGWGDAFSSIQTAVQGGTGPSATQMGTTWVPTFGTMGGLHTFTTGELAELGGAAAFVPASWATSKIFENVVAIPWFADVRCILYRTDVFAEIGIDPKEAFATLDNFVAALEQIRDSDLDIAPFVHPGRNDWNVWQNAVQWGWAYGGDILTEDGTQAAFDSSEFVAGVTAFDRLYGRGLTPENTLELNSSQCDAEFGQGRAAVMISGPWMISNFRNLEGSGFSEEVANNYAVAQFPAGPGGQYTFFGGSNVGILTSCADYEATFAFIKYLMSKESQIRYGNAIGMLPTTVEAQNDPAFTDDPEFSAFIAAAPSGKTSPNIPRWGAVENTLNSTLQSLWEEVGAAGVDTPIDEATVQARLSEAAETVNSILAS
ncbi:MAG: sugar ABC transporter substrate-binding protein [Anaerolineae bacterium]|nr:sugar ABC transporter substrate-binding protein [Anaerolineae bacterium]